MVWKVIKPSRDCRQIHKIWTAHLPKNFPSSVPISSLPVSRTKVCWPLSSRSLGFVGYSPGKLEPCGQNWKDTLRAEKGEWQSQRRSRLWNLSQAARRIQPDLGNLGVASWAASNGGLLRALKQSSFLSRWIKWLLWKQLATCSYRQVLWWSEHH